MTMTKMTYKLRPYQQKAVEAALSHFKGYGKPFIIQAATGAGKSLIIAEICHRLDAPVLVLQPSKEILEQNHQKLVSYGIEDIAIYSASKKSKEIDKFTYATIGSIYKKPELFKHFKYVIIDECHQVNPKNFDGMYTKFLRDINCKRVCGLTATPYRLVQRYTTEDSQTWYTANLMMINRIFPFFFKKIVYKIETKELIDQGFLCPIEYYAGQVSDLSELVVNSTGADYTQESLEKFWNNDRLRLIAKAIQYADKKHKKSLVFCSSIRQANNALALCSGLGIMAQVITGTTPMKERESILADYRVGKLKHILNVGVFTTGFDMPDLDCIVLARPRMSLALYYQMVGRGVRIDPENADKILKVYDLAGVVEKLGRVETIRVQVEKGGFRDQVWSEVGRMDECAIFRFKVNKRIFKKEEESGQISLAGVGNS